MSGYLSKLQKAILCIAAVNKKSRGGYIDARYSDVLIFFYRFPHHDPSPFSTSGSPQIFSMEKIGRRRYNSAIVATVKAFKRLENKGLVKRIPSRGIRLTGAGVSLTTMNQKDWRLHPRASSFPNIRKKSIRATQQPEATRMAPCQLWLYSQGRKSKTEKQSQRLGLCGHQTRPGVRYRH